MKLIAPLLVALALVIAPGFASAATPVDDQYGNPTELPSSGDIPAKPALGGGPVEPVTVAAESDTVGALPFTGAELGMIVAAGVLILTAGLTLRRIGTRSDRHAQESKLPSGM